MKAAHFICKREGSGLRNLSLIDKHEMIYRSGNWDLSLGEARTLIGGMIFLHPTKSELSAFGGEVLGVAEVLDNSLARAKRVIFRVRATLKGRGVKWRGQAHAMASYGGIIEIEP